MAKDKIDWVAVKAEYITTEASLAYLAEKYGVSHASMKRRCAKEKWADDRKKRKSDLVDDVIQIVVQNDTERIGKSLEGLQESADRLEKLVNREIKAFEKRIEKRDELGAYINEDDIKMLKGLTATIQNTADVIRDVYSIPTLKEKIDLERWEREKQSSGSGGEQGGVVFLPEIEMEVSSDANGMDATAEAD